MIDPGPPVYTEEQPFGACPICHSQDGYYNAGRTHRFICHEHKLAWVVGSNLFSSWRGETEEEQRERWREIEDYEDITKPLGDITPF